MSNNDEDQAMSELSDRFDAIAAFLSEQLGYGHLRTLTPERRRELDTEVQDAIDQWSEYENGVDAPDISTELQGLLALYREAEECVLDIRDARFTKGR